MALTCGPGLSVTEGATAVEAGSAAMARCWAKGAAAVAGPTPCGPREAGRGRREEKQRSWAAVEEWASRLGQREWELGCAAARAENREGERKKY